MISFFAQFGLNQKQVKFLSTPLKKMVLKYGKDIYLEHHWERQFAYRDSFEFPVDDGLKIVCHHDSYISRLLFNGNFERQEICFIKRFLRPDESFMDIGANIGYHSLVAARCLSGGEGKVFAFEPTPQTFGWLVQNIRTNDLKNIIPLDKALSDKPGTFAFHQYHGGRDAYNSFGNIMQSAAQSTVEVETTTIDLFMAGTSGAGISLVKIDVEGWELPVFKGGMEYLSRPDAPVLMVEFTDDNARKAGFNCQKLYDLGRELGYTWYEIKDNEIKPSPKKSYYEYQNLYAAKDVEMVQERWRQARS
jgi:FkbM family methyltransferase